MEKRALRRELFARLRALPAEERSDASTAIRARLEQDPAFIAATTVFAYLSLPAEPDLGPLLAAHPGKRWCVSRVTEQDRLCFHHLPRLEEASPGLLGIRQPDPSRHPEVEPTEADLILVPGVGFDPATRARLGRGRGHYDRFLEAALAGPKRPVLAGVLFSVQFGTIPVEPHDIPMDRLLSETGWS
jgi:5-formyltetrahydrofolate cyclo-ligase